nr:MAG TPA: hypothetical protein [Caudoviricetes sp.]
MGSPNRPTRSLRGLNAFAGRIPHFILLIVYDQHNCIINFWYYNKN